MRQWIKCWLGDHEWMAPTTDEQGVTVLRCFHCRAKSGGVNLSADLKPPKVCVDRPGSSRVVAFRAGDRRRREG